MNPHLIKRKFEERGIRRVKLGAFDIDGVLRGKYISLDKFFSAADATLLELALDQVRVHKIFVGRPLRPRRASARLQRRKFCQRFRSQAGLEAGAG